MIWTVQNQIPETSNKLIVHGILGSIRLVSGYYLIVVTSKLKIGTLLGNEVFRVENVDLLAYARNEGENSSNELTKRMIKSVLTTEYFYFSYTYDLTRSLQQLNNSSPDQQMNRNLYHRVRVLNVNFIVFVEKWENY